MSASLKYTSDRASVLGPTLRFKGELSSEEDLVIHGHVEGTVGPAPKVTIGPEAQIKAGVTADVIVVEGQVVGSVGVSGVKADQDAETARAGIAALAV